MLRRKHGSLNISLEHIYYLIPYFGKASSGLTGIAGGLEL